MQAFLDCVFGRVRAVATHATRLAAAAAVLLLAAPPAAQAQRFTVGGTVRSESGLPIENALVTLDGDQASVQRLRTDSAGRFLFTRVARGFHGLSTMRLGFTPDERMVEVVDSSVSVVIVLGRSTYALDTLRVVARRAGVFGAVLGHGGTVPLDSASVQVLRTRWSARTDKNGRFDIPDDVGSGAHVLLATRKGYQPKMLSVRTSPDSAVESFIVMDSVSGPGYMRRAMPLAEMEQRVRWMGAKAALIPGSELEAESNKNVRDALNRSPTFLKAGLKFGDLACVYVNGLPHVMGTAYDFNADEVEAVEVYGKSGDATGTLNHRWSTTTRFPCGDPTCWSSRNLSPRCRSDVAAVVIWLKE